MTDDQGEGDASSAAELQAAAGASNSSPSALYGLDDAEEALDLSGLMSYDRQVLTALANALREHHKTMGALATTAISQAAQFRERRLDDAAAAVTSLLEVANSIPPPFGAKVRELAKQADSALRLVRSDLRHVADSPD